VLVLVILVESARAWFRVLGGRRPVTIAEYAAAD
jgi:hypothetical protein